MDPNYYSIGGARAISEIVDDLYDRVQADPVLAPWFVGQDMNRLKSHQWTFLSELVGGNFHYGGRHLSHSHSGLGIKNETFDRFLRHIRDAFEAHNAPAEAVDKIMDALSNFRRDVVSVSETVNAAPANPAPVNSAPVNSTPGDRVSVSARRP